MKCIRPNCTGSMRVLRTATGEGMALQDRQCDRCAARKVFVVRPHEGEAGDVRAMLRRLARK